MTQPGVPIDEVASPTREFFDRSRSRLNLEVPAALEDLTAKAVRGDLDVDDELWEKAGVKATKPAAVLVPVVERRPEPAVLLTLRTSDLKSHSGQIAFPGGKIDPTDASPLDAALREAEEEIGLDRQFVDPIGYLDLYLTFSGFRILPVVARVSPEYRLTINPAEVAEAFEVPLEFLMHPGNHQRHKREWRGIDRQYFAMPFEDRYIWGVTAGILRNLYERIYAG
jgi:8-oxo-dGTP pyrophosphatase MutT (NUDIX family)